MIIMKNIRESIRAGLLSYWGLGTGMFCVEGSGAISNMNIRHKTEMLNEPTMFAGLYLKGVDNGSIVVEGQVPDWKKFGNHSQQKDTAARGDYLDLKIVILK